MIRKAKFYQIKHVITDVKHPVGRNRLDIEAKLAQWIDNHTPISTYRYRTKNTEPPTYTLWKVASLRSALQWSWKRKYT